jgi:methionine-gamma-lyase
VTDVAAVAAIAHDVGAILSVDATFATPVHLRPLELGADLVVHSLTKYINGHGDAMGGAVIGAAELVDRIKKEAMVNVGGAISPFNAWLIQRGSVTLPLRMRQHSESALAIAGWLERQPQVATSTTQGWRPILNTRSQLPRCAEASAGCSPSGYAPTWPRTTHSYRGFRSSCPRSPSGTTSH